MTITPDKIIKSSRRTIALEVEKSGELVVRAPFYVSKKEISKFIEKNIRWIAKRKIEMYELAKKIKPKKFKEGETFWYLGQEYPLSIVEQQRTAIDLDTKFRISEARIPNALKLFENWYRKEAKSLFPDRIDYYTSQMNLKYKNIRISGAKTRWGSCSHDNNLNFTWRLIMAPLEIIDYVVVHEVCHIKQKNHSKKFWDLVGEVVPDYKEKRKWLREKGDYLVL